MTITPYNKEHLQAHLQSLATPYGLTVNEYDFLIKDEHDRQLRIWFNKSRNHPFPITFGGGGVGFRIKAVEEIMGHVIRETNYYDWDDFDSTTFDYSLSYIHSDEDDDFMRSNKVCDDDSFNRIRPYLKRLIEEALVVASRFPTLQSLYNYGENELSFEDSIEFYGTNFRRLVVKKVLGLSYETLANQYINAYERRGDTTKLNFAQTLKDYLDTL